MIKRTTMIFGRRSPTGLILAERMSKALKAERVNTMLVYGQKSPMSETFTVTRVLTYGLLSAAIGATREIGTLTVGALGNTEDLPGSTGGRAEVVGRTV